MNTIQEYIQMQEPTAQEWLLEFTGFMQEQYPQIPGGISYQMPMYKFDKTYIAFSAAKTHFTFHTKDFHRIEELKAVLPKASFGKGCAKVKYTDTEAKPVLFKMCHTIIADHSIV